MHGLSSTSEQKCIKFAKLGKPHHSRDSSMTSCSKTSNISRKYLDFLKNKGLVYFLIFSVFFFFFFLVRIYFLCFSQSWLVVQVSSLVFSTLPFLFRRCRLQIPIRRVVCLEFPIGEGANSNGWGIGRKWGSLSPVSS